jgi:lipopolysaccharide exporter
MANWIKSWQDRFRQGGFLADVVVLAGGTAFSQALLFLATPLITRLYEPADFGVWSLIRSLGSIAAVVACWRYELSIVLPKQDKEAANMFAASVLIAIAMSGLLLLIVSLFGIQVAQLLSTTEILPWLWVLPLMLLLTGIYQAGNYWSTRKNQFSRLAISRIVQSIVLVSVQIGLALTIGPSYWSNRRHRSIGNSNMARRWQIDP